MSDYETVVPMKIYPLHYGVYFHPSVSSFFTVKKTKEFVDELVPSSHKTAACTHDIISHAPAEMYDRGHTSLVLRPIEALLLLLS